MADMEDREEGELVTTEDDSLEVEEGKELKKEEEKTEVTSAPGAPSKPTSEPKVALERVVTWPDWAEEGHPLHGYPPALQSLWKNATAFIQSFKADADINEVFLVSHGIDQEGMYPEGVSFNDEMRAKVQDSCRRIGYKPHYVEWKIQFDASKLQVPQLVLRFKWLAKPRIVVVQSKIIYQESKPLISDFLMRSEYILKCLWHCDAGHDIPNDAAKTFLMQEFHVSTFIDLSIIFGFPFKWAQNFLTFTKTEDLSCLPFKRFIKGVLSTFHHLIRTWDDTRGVEMTLLTKFHPYFQLHAWRSVEVSLFRKTFRGLCEKRLDESNIAYPGRLHMASVECPEFTIYVGAILYKMFPAVLPNFLVSFKRKSSLEENISKATLEVIVSDLNNLLLGNASNSIPELSLHVIQMINLVYHIDDLMLRKPLPHIVKVEDTPAKTEQKRQIPGPSSASAKKRSRDDKAAAGINFRRKFSKVSRKSTSQSSTSTTTKIGPLASRPCSLPISIHLNQLSPASRSLLISVSPTSPPISPEDSDQQDVDFSNYLIISEDTLQGDTQSPHPTTDPLEEGDDNVFYSPNSSGPNSPPIPTRNNNVFFGTDVSSGSPTPASPASVEPNTDTESALLTPDSMSPNAVDNSYSINEFPANMEVAEQIVVSFEGEIVDAIASFREDDDNFRVSE